MPFEDDRNWKDRLLDQQLLNKISHNKEKYQGRKPRNTGFTNSSTSGNLKKKIKHADIKSVKCDMCGKIIAKRNVAERRIGNINYCRICSKARGKI